MKFRSVVLLIVTFFLLLAVSFWVPWEWAWVDRISSEFLSRSLGVSVHVHHVKVRRWSMISFDSIELAFANEKASLRSGAGSIRFSGSGFFERTPPMDIELNHVSVPESLTRRIPFLPLPPSNTARSSLRVDRLRAYVLQKKKYFIVHLLEFSSKEIEAKGGIKYTDDGKVDKAHVVLFFSRAVVERLPESIWPRIVTSQEGKGRIRFIISKQTLTVIGVHGPLLKAQWG